MFAGSDSGGERAAAMYSLIGSCKLNGINPRAYLEYVLTVVKRSRRRTKEYVQATGVWQ
ncbi:hypothetical protein R75465_08411 [Paraburkholderia aspalathi]|nr:hypothetical protein R75465_08411 [Paraburkholderia aspalathi]